MVHPPPSGSARSACATISLASSIGRPFDNTLAIGRLIVRGIWSALLAGRRIWAAASRVIGRMDYAYELQEEAFFLGPTSRC
jgi:hypothetical protein